MASPVQPLIDHAAPILAAEPSITDEDRASLWDAFQSKNPDELKQHLDTLPIPDDTKQKLHQAKLASVAPPAPAGPPIGQAEKGINVITRLGTLDPKLLDVAESHPNILKVLVGAATAPEKEAGAASGESKPAGKVKPSNGGQDAASAAPLAAGPTADYPPTPSGHALVQASDMGFHHIPVENLEKARKIDPGIKVLHVQP